MRGEQTRHCDLDIELTALLDPFSDVLEMPRTTLVRAVLRGALVTGSVEALAVRGLRDMPPLRRTGATPVGFWTPAEAGERGSPGVRSRPVVWTHGPYRLTRIGWPGPVAGPDDGWWLCGPGVTPLNMGLRSTEARRAATPIVQRAEAEVAEGDDL